MSFLRASLSPQLVQAFADAQPRVTPASRRDESSASTEAERSAPEVEVDDEKEVDGFIRRWRAGELEPMAVEVRRPEMHPTVRRVLQFYVDVRGLREAEVDSRPVMLSCTFIERHLGISQKTANRCFQWLVDNEVLVIAEKRKIPGRPLPVHCYDHLPVAARPEVVRHDDTEPRAELVEHPLVPRAVGAVVDRPLDAAGNWADDGGFGLHRGT